MRQAYFILQALVFIFITMFAIFVLNVVNAGTWQEVEAWDEECAYVPADMACLSACAFAWMKSPNRTNDGIIGLHMPAAHNAATQAQVNLEVNTHMMAFGFGGYYQTVRDETSLRVFLMFQGNRAWLQDWRTLRGYRVTADPDDLRCG